MRHLHKPFTIPVHGELTNEVNDMIIAIKLHYCDLSNEPDQDAVKKAQAYTRKPTPDNIIELLTRCRDKLNTVRENPVKY